MNDFLPPSDEQAEECVIGSVLVDTDALKRVMAVVKPADFYTIKHRWVFEALLKLSQNNQPIDAVTLRRELESSGKLAEIGGPAQITYYMTVVPTAMHAGGYAKIVADMATRRSLIKAASDIATQAYDVETPVAEQTGRAYSLLRSINTYNSDAVDLRSASMTLLNKLEYWADNPLRPGDVRGERTYLAPLDGMIGGAERDDLIIIAARPGVGKSCLSGIVAYEKAKRNERVLFFSLEMSQERIIRRMASRLARVPFDRAKHGQCVGDELAALMRHVGDIAELPMIIRDQSGITTAQIDAIVSQSMPLDMIFIDNINIIGDPKEKGENRATQVGRISANLKNMARNYNVPVWCICHMNRQIEARSDGVPTLADLKESGDIEQNADEVIFMFTQKSDIKRKWDGTPDDKAGAVITFMPAKLRDGNTDAVAKMYFNKPIQDFAPIARDT